MTNPAASRSASSYERVAELLGITNEARHRPIQTSIDVHEVVSIGLPARSMGELQRRYSLKREDFTIVFQVTDRTLQRRRSLSRLSTKDSDLLWRLATVLYSATEVLGGEEKATSWLHTSNRALGGRTPLSLLSSEAGFEEVRDALGRIEFGVWS